ncbi:hypothetical protein Tco_1196566, partial [Tanacetum coccineum]
DSSYHKPYLPLFSTEFISRLGDTREKYSKHVVWTVGPRGGDEPAVLWAAINGPGHVGPVGCNWWAAKEMVPCGWWDEQIGPKLSWADVVVDQTHAQ